HELAEQLAEGLLADRPDPSGGQLEAAFSLLDEGGFLEEAGELGGALEGAGRVVAEELPGPVEVDLGELAGLGGLAEQVLEVIHVAEGVKEPRHLAHREGIVAL